MRASALLQLAMADAPVRTRRVVRDGILVEGPDALSWLQGQLTQDLEAMAVAETRHSLVLSPQGKVESFCRVTREAEEGFLLDVEAGFGNALGERLRRFKLRVRVTMEPVAVRAEERLGLGWEALGPPEVAGEQGFLQPPESTEDTAFELARIKTGFPRLGRELTERSIPQEAGEELVARTVSFTKGCYTGQELVARLDARGSNVPRKLRLLEASGGPVPEPGAKVTLGGSEIGQVTSAAATPEGGWTALSYVKRAAAGNLGEVFVDTGAGGVPATMLLPGASATTRTG